MTPLSQSPQTRFVVQIAGILALTGGAGFLFGVATAQAPLGLNHFPLVAGALLVVLLVAACILASGFARRLNARMRHLIERHQELIESIDGIVWEADAATMQLTFVSKQAETRLGYTLQEWMQPGFFERCLHWDDNAWVFGQLAACARENVAVELEYRFFDKDGAVLWLHNTVSPVPDDERKVSLLRGLMLDVTTRRRQEDQAHQFLVEKETILDNVLVGIVHLKDRHVISCNRRFAEMFGCTQGELIGESTERLYASAAIFHAFGERAYRALDAGNNYMEEVLLRRKDGRLFWGAINGRAINPLRPGDGGIWIFADITERRQAEEEVHKLLRAVEQSPVSIVITDRDGRIEYVNPRFSRVTGYTLEEVIGRNPRMLKSNDTPDAIYQDLWKTITGGREWRGVLRNRRKDGELFWEEASISPIFDEKGRITHFLAVKEDIGERKEAEDALRKSHEAYVSILATSLDGFWLIDAGGRLLDVNETYVRQSGYSQEELLSMTIHDLVAFPPAVVDERIARVIRKGSDQFDSLHRRRDGSVWHVEVSASHRAGGGGELFVFLRDITARKQIQQQLEEQQEHLETLVRQRTADLAKALEAAKVAERAKDAFLANVSHELRTPLNAVIGLSGLAQKASTDPRQRETLKNINDAGQTLLEIINDLLDLTKIAAGEMRFKLSPFSPRELLSRVVSVMAHRAAEKGLQIEDAVADDVPEVLLGDALRVEQILLNLLSNSIKFTEAGGVAVRLRSTAREGTAVRLQIEVEDSGIGLSGEQISRLFKPFAQADISMTRKHGGTGLGLAICKQLAEAMDGEISVASRPGRGSTFRVELRLGLGGASDLPMRPDDGDDGSNLRFPSAHVLVVDDQPLNRDVVFQLLATVGIVPRQAANGREAIDILLNAGPAGFDLVLMDVQMPVLDGLSATREIRALPGYADLPIVAMTAHTMEHEKASYHEVGMNDHLGKPFTMRSFFALLAKWLSAKAVPTTPGFATSPSSGAAPSALSGQTAGVDPPLPAIDGLDCKAALPRFAGDVERYSRWLRIFADEADDFLTQVGDLLAGARLDEVRKLVHAFKGRAGMLGMLELHALAGAFENATQRAGAAEAMLPTLRQQVTAMREALRAAIGADKITN